LWNIRTSVTRANTYVVQRIIRKILFHGPAGGLPALAISLCGAVAAGCAMIPSYMDSRPVERRLKRVLCYTETVAPGRAGDKQTARIGDQFGNYPLGPTAIIRCQYELSL